MTATQRKKLETIIIKLEIFQCQAKAGNQIVSNGVLDRVAKAKSELLEAIRCY